jgi:GTP-binding protein EngB required for normal cell division
MKQSETWLQAISRLCTAFGIESLQSRLRAALEVLQGDGVVDVAVLGQFKAGKSSFLNSLIGREIVPVDVLPATAVVTRIGYGPKERAVVRRLSGSEEEIPVERLAEFVTERHNPANEKQVAMVEVELPSLAPFRGVRFVDTPGLGSVFTHNTQASMEWLPRVGGALVAVSVNHPLSEQDVRLLGEVFQHTPEVAILLTRADLVSKSQLEVVVDFTRQQIARLTGKELPILPISVHPAHSELQSRVQDYLLRRIAEQHEEKFDEIVAHKVRALAAACREYLVLAQTAATAAGQARLDLLEVMQRERHDIGSVKAEISLFSRELKSQVRGTAGERFHAYHGEVAGRLWRDLRERMASWRGNLAKTTGRFQEWLRAALEAELSGVSAHGEVHLSGFLFEAQASLHRSVRAFQDRLAKEIERALGLSFAGAQFEAKIQEPARPDVRMGQTFDTHIDLLWFVIPMTLFRPLIERHFLRLIPWEVEKNLSRLAGQWAESVNASIENLVGQALQFMEEEIATIERMVSQAKDRRPAIEEALATLDGLVQQTGGQVDSRPSAP